MVCDRAELDVVLASRMRRLETFVSIYWCFAFLFCVFVLGFQVSVGFLFEDGNRWSFFLSLEVLVCHPMFAGRA